MKVAIITYAFHTSTMPLAKYLTILGHKVDLYCLMNSSFTNHFTINLTKFNFKNGFVAKSKFEDFINKNLLSYLNSLNDFNIFLFSKRRRYFYINYFFQMFSLSRSMGSKKYDIIHFVGQNEEYIFLYKLLRFPKIFTFHEVLNDTFLMNKHEVLYNNFQKNKIKSKLIDFISQKANNVIFHSSNTKETYIKVYNPKNRNISVTKFGLFETYKLFADNSPEESNTILYFGIIRPHKGLEYLVDAFEIIKKEIHDVKLIIAGRGEVYFNRNKLKDDQIELINHSISEAELVKLNKRATLVVCPYTSASQSGIPVTSFNFLKPIVASNVDGISEYVIDGYNGLLVPPCDSISLAQKIIQLMVDDDLRFELKKNIAKMNEENYETWLNIARQTAEIYQDEIESSKIRSS